MGGGLGVEGVECHFEVVRKFLESFLIIGDGGIGHSVIPHFDEECTMTFAHLIEHDHDFVVV